MSTEHAITDEAPRTHFAMIPNVVDDLGLSAKAYRLYGHLKRLTGETGKANEGQDAMASKCNMAKNTVVAAKRELVKKKLIRIKETRDRITPDEIVILDIWKMNLEHFGGVNRQTDRGANEIPHAAQFEYRDAAQTEDRKKSSTEEGEENTPVGAKRPHKANTYVALVEQNAEILRAPLDQSEKRNLGSYLKRLIEQQEATPSQMIRFASHYPTRRSENAKIKYSQAWTDVLNGADRGAVSTNGHQPETPSEPRKPASKPRPVTDEEAGIV